MSQLKETPMPIIRYRDPHEIVPARGVRTCLHVAPLLKSGERTPQELLVDVTLTGECDITTTGAVHVVEAVIGRDAHGDERRAWVSPSSLVEVFGEPFDYAEYEWTRSVPE